MSSISEKMREVASILLVVIGVGVVLHALHALGLGDSDLDWLFDDYVYNTVLLGAAGACALRAVAGAPERRAWLAFGLGLALWALGDLYWTVEFTGAAEIPYPSPADVLYLAGYPALFAGITLLVRAQVRAGHSSVSMWLDGAIGALAAAALGSALLEPALVDLTRGTTAEVATNLAYPLGDLLLFSFVVGALAIVGTAGRLDWGLIAGGLLLSAIADGVFLYQEATGTYAEGTPLDTLWLLSAGLIALAAWARVGAAPVEAGSTSLLFPSAFATVAVALQVHDLTRPLSELAGALTTATLAVIVLRLFVTFADNSRLLAILRREAVTDALTDLGNRRKLLTDLQAELDRDRSTGDTALAIFDLDGFKAYNDSYGHGAGDLLLRRLGGNLAAAVRHVGTAYRLGGDEFCVLVSAEHVKLDSILASASAALTEEGEGFSISCSWGSVRLPWEADNPTDALRLADRRMYAAKGRRIDSAGHQTQNALLSVLREREPDLGDHLQGVARLSVKLGKRLAMTAEELDVLRRAAELHDIGKIAIPDDILHRSGPLKDHEWALLRTHTLVGERILEAAPAMAPVARLVRSTHERWDGKGYPDGLAGEEVPLGARIIFVSDAFDAMTAHRSYKPRVSLDEALAELRRNAGTQFDPMLVELLCELVVERPVGIEDDVFEQDFDAHGARALRVPGEYTKEPQAER